MRKMKVIKCISTLMVVVVALREGHCIFTTEETVENDRSVTFSNLKSGMNSTFKADRPNIDTYEYFHKRKRLYKNFILNKLGEKPHIAEIEKDNNKIFDKLRAVVGETQTIEGILKNATKVSYSSLLTDNKSEKSYNSSLNLISSSTEEANKDYVVDTAIQNNNGSSKPSTQPLKLKTKRRDKTSLPSNSTSEFHKLLKGTKYFGNVAEDLKEKTASEGAPLKASSETNLVTNHTNLLDINSSDITVSEGFKNSVKNTTNKSKIANRIKNAKEVKTNRTFLNIESEANSAERKNDSGFEHSELDQELKNVDNFSNVEMFDSNATSEGSDISLRTLNESSGEKESWDSSFLHKIGQVELDFSEGEAGNASLAGDSDQTDDDSIDVPLLTLLELMQDVPAFNSLQDDVTPDMNTGDEDKLSHQGVISLLESLPSSLPPPVAGPSQSSGQNSHGIFNAVQQLQDFQNHQQLPIYPVVHQFQAPHSPTDTKVPNLQPENVGSTDVKNSGPLDPYIATLTSQNALQTGDLDIPPAVLANLLVRLRMPTASEIVNVIPDTRLTPELTTAIADFITNLSDAIAQFLTDLQAALAANPILGLILAIGLLGLLWHLFPYKIEKKKKGYGYGHGHGHGGGYHRRRDWKNDTYRSFGDNTLEQLVNILEGIESFKSWLEEHKL